ncbi:unnamed protein product [Boreogadus saida]
MSWAWPGFSWVLAVNTACLFRAVGSGPTSPPQRRGFEMWASRSTLGWSQGFFPEVKGRHNPQRVLICGTTGQAVGGRPLVPVLTGTYCTGLILIP